MRKNLSERGETVGLLDIEQPANPARRKRSVAPPSEPWLDPEDAEDSSFLRDAQRVEPRRRRRSSPRISWSSNWVRATAACLLLALLGLTAFLILQAKSLLLHNPRFLLRSPANIQVDGNRVIPSSQVLAIFAPDLGRSIFRLPMAARQAQLEQIRWVRRAAVMRLWPDQLRVSILERTPVAFARDGNTVRLIDTDGVLLDLPAAANQHDSFPVLTGVSASELPATRAARVAIYRQFTAALDAGGDAISNRLSEVDLSDPEDIRAVFTGAHPPVVHFGDSDYLARYRAYQAHLSAWLVQYPQLRSVDLRYGRQVVLDTGAAGLPAADAAPLSAGGPSTIVSAPSKPASSKTRAAKNPAGKIAKKKSPPSHHRHAAAAPAPKKHPSARPKIERGHPVTNPIMHVVAGT